MKYFIQILLSLIFSGIVVQSFAQHPAGSADMVVAADGSGDFTSIQAAINAVPSNSELRTVIYVKRGLYNTEKLIIPADKINVTLVGESREETVISYHIYDCAQGKCPADDAALWTGDNIRTSATLTILGDGFRAENLTIENTAGPVGQAQAITVRADRVEFVSCNLTGYQDTIYLWSEGNRSYFENCLVVGRTDYIYGGGIAVFNMCEIRSWGGGWITAPSTSADQEYGFVFYACDITYADNSPRPGDDGELIALGRPWHNCPKVTWLYCDMTAMIDPLGWPSTWNMDYAPDSSGLHLYEYGNSGDGADMSGRSNWIGIRELSEAEALLYTPKVVLAGEDNWDPTAIPPAVTSYQWTGGAETDAWLLASNWDPVSIPTLGETAVVDGAFRIQATGEHFEADLSLNNGAILDIVDSSSVNLLSISKGGLSAEGVQAFSGRIKTKDTLTFLPTGEINLYARISGVHEIVKESTGKINLLEDNSGFSGAWIIKNGILEASGNMTLGKAEVNLKEAGTLVIGHESAMDASAPLYLVGGALLVMNVDMTISQLYIDGTMMAPGSYDAVSNPGLISGPGKVIVGKPSLFQFVGGANGNWDEAVNYLPALLPEEGDTVLCDIEIETTASVFKPTLFISSGGRLRLRGDISKNHMASGNIHLGKGTSVAYNTGGTGMAITAPLIVEGNTILNMESGNESGSTMTLMGSLAGKDTIFARNNGKGVENSGRVLLLGNNAGFRGTWDLRLQSDKNPELALQTVLEGASKDAFGQSSIVAGDNNRVILNHKFCAGDTLNLSLQGSARAEIKSLTIVKAFYLNGELQDNGVYSASSHPEVFEGEAELVVDSELEIPAGPGDLMATEILHDQISISWTIHADNADGHVILKDLWKIDTVEVDTFRLTGLYPEQDYEIGVYAFNLLGNSDTAFIDVTTAAIPLGNEKTMNQSFNVFPNPARDRLYLKGLDQPEWELYDLTGLLLENGRSNTVDLFSLPKGSYILKFRERDADWHSLKFVRE